MEKILVTTDFSGNSRAGIRFAIQLAAKTNAELLFYHIIEVLKPTSWSNKKYKEFVDQKTKVADAKLRRFIQEIYIKDKFVPGNNSYFTEIAEGGYVQTLIINFARKIKADFICMSTRGASKLLKLFGTVASGMITYSAIPLIIVPHGYRVKPINTIFYASDFSSIGPELKAVAKFAEPLNAKIKVYHYDYMLHIDEIRSKLEKLAKKYSSSKVDFNFKKQEIELSLSDHLEKDIKKEKASLVVLFTKQNRNWFDKLFARNEARDMAFHADVPLLIFRKKVG